MFEEVALEICTRSLCCFGLQLSARAMLLRRMIHSLRQAKKGSCDRCTGHLQVDASFR